MARASVAASIGKACDDPQQRKRTRDPQPRREQPAAQRLRHGQRLVGELHGQQLARGDEAFQRPPDADRGHHRQKPSLHAATLSRGLALQPATGAFVTRRAALVTSRLRGPVARAPCVRHPPGSTTMQHWILSLSIAAALAGIAPATHAKQHCAEPEVFAPGVISQPGNNWESRLPVARSHGRALDRRQLLRRRPTHRPDVLRHQQGLERTGRRAVLGDLGRRRHRSSPRTARPCTSPPSARCRRAIRRAPTSICGA